MPHRILVIEDNLGDALMIQEAVNSLSIAATLHVITDGEKALKEIAALDALSTPDVIIIDLNLPRVSGLTLLTQIRAMQKFERTAVMVLTSSQSAQDRVKAEQAGANAFVSKPFTFDDFLQTVGGAIRSLISADGSTLNRERSTHHARPAHRLERRRSGHRLTGWVRAARQA
jgi:two-component system response regulator